VDPDCRGLGLGTWAAARNEALAAERGTEGVRVRISDRDDAAAQLLGRRGYVRVRSAYTMRRELRAGEEPGSTPAGVTIRTFETGRDERVLHEVHEASFADHWGFHPVPYETFAVEMYDAHDWDPGLALLAEVDEDVVGHAVSLSSDDGGYVAILGVVPAARGRGIAKALLRCSFSTLAHRGHRVVRLGVDAQNPNGAVALYEGVGMTVSHAYDMYDLGTPDALRV
jgi:mycothiol synthase